MALDDNATLVIGAGNYLTAPEGTPIPTDLLAPDVDYDNMGHTSLEDILSLSSEGGEATVIATLQNQNLRTKYSKRTETFNFTLQQFDAESLKFHFGANMIDLPDGSLGVPDQPVPTVRAWLVVFVDGDNVFAFHAPKAEIFRADDMSLSDTESLAGLPIGVKPIKISGNEHAYSITPLGTVVPPA